MIVSTKDFSKLFRDRGPTLQNVFSFSPDGSYFAAFDRATQETPGGGTSAAGGVITVWNANDFTKVSSIPVRFPFAVSSIAISLDNTILAVSQEDFIDAFSLPSGESKGSIEKLCSSYQRKILFTPTTSPTLLESSDCSSSLWDLSGTDPITRGRFPFDFSNTVFDKYGQTETISYPWPMSDIQVYEWFYYMFSNKDTLRFQNRHSVDTYSCDIIFSVGSYECQPKHRILATDGEYYGYRDSADGISILSPQKNETLYSPSFA